MTSPAHRPALITAHSSRVEERTGRHLEAIFERYDLSPWYCARVLQIDEGLSTSSCLLKNGAHLIHWRPFSDEQEQRLGARLVPLLLSLYIHEQLHAHLDQQVGMDAALIRVQDWYPQVPDRTQGGARDDASTHLHLILCTLELIGLSHFLGTEEARNQVAHARGYQWIYAEVLKHTDRFRTLIEQCNLNIHLELTTQTGTPGEGEP